MPPLTFLVLNANANPVSAVEKHFTVAIPARNTTISSGIATSGRQSPKTG